MSLDLHTGHPYWQRPGPRVLAPTPLRRDLDIEAVVVGAGMSGALVADALVRAGLSVAVLEAAEPAMGSTVASTALLQYDLDVPLTRLIPALGIARAQRAYRIGIEALALLHQFTTELGVPFERLPSLYVATSADRVAALREELDARHLAGIAVDWVSGDRLAQAYALHAHAAIRSYSAATTDPYALTVALLRRAHSGGARLFAPARVSSITRDGAHRLVHTREGPVLRARWVVWATGYQSAALLSPGLVNLDSTYAIAARATEGGTEALRRCIWWEFAEPYLYSRWDGDTLLVGGEDEEFFDAERRDRLIGAKARTLAAKYERLAPGMALTITNAWTGAFATTPDGLGYIGPMPEDPQVMFSLGFGGNGMTMSAMAARIITDLALGRPNQDASIYRFGRATVAGASGRGGAAAADSSVAGGAGDSAASAPAAAVRNPDPS